MNVFDNLSGIFFCGFFFSLDFVKPRKPGRVCCYGRVAYLEGTEHLVWCSYRRVESCMHGGN